MKRQALLYEGKAKKVYETDQTDLVWITYKDEATAFNGEKYAQLQGKGELTNQLSSFFFHHLAEHGIPNHWVEMLSPTEQLVRRVTIIPLEVVVRNRVAGSLARRLGISEGTELPHPVVEFYYKSDELGDPLLTEDHIAVMSLATPQQVVEMREMALEVNRALRRLFQANQLQLVDMKLEFGVKEGRLLLADEISPDTCRLWDMNTGKKLDKDRFRQDLGDVLEAYREVFKRVGGES
ncbi:phosphoribosylaminoimidazolesuccinocarboxamide synthase [Mechercharimyces sp. CAU 1602]|uniref:phosphoribosylaminoimidazolesuccinocarboxamide synthase n=1 Tax=Mechercharimyces sp. CAU 1602 TaxID=2973933 RepID=UPI002161C033|nr:phosphoribosylaminoimidazolesuccinocarboxamide synthase [Mechercharimyces sp. CAU 1602]MCS1352020.1 phosphoribosylaminoimidazolesuccinocarboxamide synthase [Mechercharimyces sp. CAU 1602]